MALIDNLVSYWKLDEASGTRVDSHGTNDLTDNNTVASATGKINSAADLELSNSEFLSHADNTDLSTGDIDFTFQVWVKIESKTAVNYECPLAKSSEFILLRDSGAVGVATDRFVLLVNNSILNKVVANNLGSPSLDTWYCIHCWHDSVNNQLGISVNAGTPDTSSYSGGITDGTDPFWIGGNSADGVGGFFDGIIDEVGFWKRVLTSQERTDLYNGGAGLAYPFSSGVNPSKSDDVAVTESITVNLKLMPQIFDGVTVTEAATVNVVLMPAVFDGVTITESSSVSVLLMPAVFDSVTASEVVTALLPFLVPSASDTVTVSEAAVALLPFLVPSVSDDVTATDVGTVLLPKLLAAVFDSLTVDEAVAVSLASAGTLPISASDSVTVAESVSVYLLLGVSVNDGVTVTEQSVARLLVMPSVSDTATVTESAAALLPFLVPSVFDAVTVAENVTVILATAGTLPISAFDTVTTSESASVYLLVAPVASDGVTVTESASVNLPIGISASDAVTIAEAVSVLRVSGTVEVQAFDSVSVAEDISVSLFPTFALFVTAYDEVTVSDQNAAEFFAAVHVLDFPRTRGINDAVN